MRYILTETEDPKYSNGVKIQAQLNPGGEIFDMPPFISFQNFKAIKPEDVQASYFTADTELRRLDGSVEVILGGCWAVNRPDAPTDLMPYDEFKSKYTPGK